MKKLMFAVAAVAAGVALADVTSANIVGYQNLNQEETGTFARGATFKAVTGDFDGIDIQSIIPQVPAEHAGELEDGEAQIQILAIGGEVEELVYFWLPATSGDATEGAGWYTQNKETFQYEYAERTFGRGYGFIYAEPYFYKMEGDEEVQIPGNLLVSGEVKTEAKLVSCPETGTFLFNNYRPYALDIQKISPVVPKDHAGELEDGEAQIQILAVGGEVDEVVYFWLPATSGDATEGAGWYIQNKETFQYEYAVKSFAAGEGFIYAEPYYYKIEGDEEVQIEGHLQFAE